MACLTLFILTKQFYLATAWNYPKNNVFVCCCKTDRTFENVVRGREGSKGSHHRSSDSFSLSINCTNIYSHTKIPTSGFFTINGENTTCFVDFCSISQLLWALCSGVTLKINYLELDMSMSAYKFMCQKISILKVEKYLHNKYLWVFHT